MTKKNLLRPMPNAILFNLIIKVCAVAKVSFMVGSQFAFFSLAQAITPLAGAFAGIAGCFAFFGAKLGIAYLLSSQVPFHFLAYHVPGLCASLYWATSVRWLKASVPVLCMGLFLVHPTGSSAALYCLFWLIPIVATYFMKETVFARSVGSTFTAHAVGSVIWLYTVPMNADTWLMLIPVVIIERALFVVGMMGAYRLLSAFMNVLALNDNQKILGTARKV
jgi:hypothetical protein